MLDKIYSTYKQKEINSLLDNFSSISHNSRVYTVGFLKYCGYSDSEIIDVISSRGMSRDFTTGQVLSIRPRGSIIRKESSLVIAKRSVANIPSNIIEITKFRYDMIPLGDKNKNFFRGAKIIAYGYKDKLTGAECYNLYNNSFYKYDPANIPVYRSISGEDHVLFVADLDKSNFDNDYDKLLCFAKNLSNKWSWDILKFSGSEGIHLIKFLPVNTTLKDLQSKALEFDPKKSKLDWHLFNDLNWKIRGYCVNLKTGLISDDVDIQKFNFNFLKEIVRK